MGSLASVRSAKCKLCTHGNPFEGNSRNVFRYPDTMRASWLATSGSDERLRRLKQQGVRAPARLMWRIYLAQPCTVPVIHCVAVGDTLVVYLGVTRTWAVCQSRPEEKRGVCVCMVSDDAIWMRIVRWCWRRGREDGKAGRAVMGGSVLSERGLVGATFQELSRECVEGMTHEAGVSSLTRRRAWTSAVGSRPRRAEAEEAAWPGLRDY